MKLKEFNFAKAFMQHHKRSTENGYLDNTNIKMVGIAIDTHGKGIIKSPLRWVGNSFYGRGSTLEDVKALKLFSKFLIAYRGDLLKLFPNATKQQKEAIREMANFVTSAKTVENPSIFVGLHETEDPQYPDQYNHSIVSMLADTEQTLGIDNVTVSRSLDHYQLDQFHPDQVMEIIQQNFVKLAHATDDAINPKPWRVMISPDETDVTSGGVHVPKTYDNSNSN